MVPGNTDEVQKTVGAQKPITLTKDGTFVLTHNQSLETLLLGLSFFQGFSIFCPAKKM